MDKVEFDFLVTTAEKSGSLLKWVDAGVLSDADACELLAYREEFAPKYKKLSIEQLTCR